MVRSKNRVWSVCLILFITDLTSALRCYTCTYTVSGQDIQMGSSHGCRDEFILDSLISSMSCAGNCSASYEKQGDRLSWRRGCSQNCMNQTSENSWTQCCGTDFCNAASPLTRTSSLLGLIMWTCQVLMS